jgi:large subunit ribosomal protein L22
MKKVRYGGNVLSVRGLSKAQLARLAERYGLETEGTPQELRDRLEEHIRDRTARTIGRELPISTKKTVELCRALRGMRLGDAKAYLKDVVEMRRAVPYRRYTRRAAHKPGMAAGGYPVKAARALLKLLEDAETNAEFLGRLDPETMILRHIAASPGMAIRGRIPRARGRSTPWDQRTVNVEVILEETEEAP